MALDSTAKKRNFLYSLKKYVIDKINIIENIDVIFETLLPPSKEVERWVSVVVGPLNRDTISELFIEVYCVNRRDPEGTKLAELLDLVAGYFSVDSDQEDSLKRIPFYDATTQTQNGSMIVVKCEEGDTLKAPDQAKFTVLSITLKMASRI